MLGVCDGSWYAQVLIDYLVRCCESMICDFNTSRKFCTFNTSHKVNLCKKKKLLLVFVGVFCCLLLVFVVGGGGFSPLLLVIHYSLPVLNSQ